MNNIMKKRVAFLAGFFACVLVACCVVTGFCAKKYTLGVYFFNEDVKLIDTSCTTENGNVELKNVSVEDDIVYATFVPKSIGADTVTFYTKTDDINQDAEVTLNFFAGPFNTIFSFSSLLDFEGSVYVICLFMLATAVLAAVMIVSFVEYARKSAFGYTMVVCGGVGIFSLHYLAVSIYTLTGSFTSHYMYGLGNYILEFANSGVKFSRSIAALMAVFCALLIISNLFLLFHEGYRVQNLLGVALGVIWFAGHVISNILEEQSFFDYYGIFIPLSNGVAVVISYFECMLFSTALCAFLASLSKPPYDRDYIVILGCSIRSDGSLTPILRGRVDAALRFAEAQLRETGRQVKFVPSGGQGSDEIISEGEAMKRYLEEQGVESNCILPEIKSVNTYENIKLSKGVIEDDAEDGYNAAFATTNYHIFRGYILSEKLGLQNARGISSKTKWYFFPNAFLRELVGLIADKWKLHLLFIILILAVYTGIYYLA